MGQIKEYIAPGTPIRGLQPSETGADALAMEGRRLGAFYSQSGSERMGAARSIAGGLADVGQGLKKVQDYVDRQEVTEFYAKQAQFDDELVTNWNQTRNQADPNDHEVASRWNQEVLQPAMDKFAEQFTTQKGKERVAEHFSRLSEHLFTVQRADAATAASEAAVLNITKVNNNNAASLVKDPTRLSFVNQTSDRMIDDYLKSSSDITAEQRAHIQNMGKDMRRSNTIAAFHGMAEANPLAAKAALDGGYGRDDLNEGDRSTLDQYAHAQNQIKIEQDKAAEAKQHSDNIRAANNSANDLVNKFIQPDGSFQAGPDFFNGVKQIAAMPDAPDGLARSMFAFGQSQRLAEQQGKFVQTDPAVREDFTNRMYLPPTDPNALKPVEVWQAAAMGRVSKGDATMFHNLAVDLAKDPMKRDAMQQYSVWKNSMKTSITRSSMLGAFPQEDQRWGEFQHDTMMAFQQAYASGTWKDTLNPKSATYLGRNLSNYQYNTQDALKTVQQNLTNGVSLAPPAGGSDKARKPNESAEDFLKRTGGH